MRLQRLLEKSEANKAKNKKAIQDKYCYRYVDVEKFLWMLDLDGEDVHCMEHRQKAMARGRWEGRKGGSGCGGGICVGDA